MPIFGFSELSEILDAGQHAGLATRRDRLLFGFPEALRDSLPGWNAATPAVGLAADIQALNQWVEASVEGKVPLAIWLMNASAICGPLLPESALYFDTKAKDAIKATAAAAPAVLPVGNAGEAGMVVPERVIHKPSFLSDSYFKLACRRANAVARLTVPQYEGGAPRLNRDGTPKGSYGTGWLIGPKHMVTNWHVAHARAPDDPVPDADTIARQIKEAAIEFDYVAEGQQTQSTSGSLVHIHKDLDYAVIKLAEAEDREPFPLAIQPFEIDPEDAIAANIIQHPNGGPRQYGIRDNIIAKRSGNDLAYFTDTMGGSSGAPVCDDAWNVIALHKATTLRFGNLDFQGKDTAWVNTGTLIGPIVDDLRQAQPDLWDAIAAVLV